MVSPTKSKTFKYDYINTKEIITKILDNNSVLELEIKDKVISEDLCLKHHTIDKVIIFNNCLFEKDILFQYATFKHTIRFNKCKFKGQVIWGDESKYETVSLSEKDIYFNESIFWNKVFLDGIICKGSIYFNRCRFLLKPTQTSFGVQKFGLSLSSSNISSSLNFEHCILLGGLNLNACKLGIGLCLSHVKFLNKESSIDFIAANFGIALEILGCYFKCNIIDLDGICIGTCCHFWPKEIFQWDKNDFLKTSDNKKQIRSKFAQHGIELDKHIFIDKNERIDDNNNKYIVLQSPSCYYILIDCDTYYNVLEGIYFDNVSNLNLSYSNIGIHIGFISVIIKGSFVDLSNITCREFKCSNSTFESNSTIDFRHTKIGWIFDSSNSYFKAQLLTFNGLTCSGGAFFRNTQVELIDKTEENSEDSAIDFSFCNFGKNLQFNNLICINSTFIKIDSSKIGDSLVIESISSNKDFIYMYMCNTQVHEFLIKDLKNTLFNFDGFKFDIYSESELHWHDLVRRQLPAFFSEDIYIQFEKYYLAKGDTEEAKKIYYEGRCAYRKATKRKWGFKKYMFDTFLKLSVGYGVKNVRLLGIILLLIIGGALVECYYMGIYTSSVKCLQQSLIKFIPFQGGLKNIAISYIIKPDNLYNSYFTFHKIAGFILTPLLILFFIATLTGFIKNKIKQLLTIILLFIISGTLVECHYIGINPSFIKCFQRSLINFLPVGGIKDVILSYNIKPDIFYNSYYIFHKIAGFIFIPLFIASITGFVKKRNL